MGMAGAHAEEAPNKHRQTGPKEPGDVAGAHAEEAPNKHRKKSPKEPGDVAGAHAEEAPNKLSQTSPEMETTKADHTWRKPSEAEANAIEDG
jgi:hypothetical protein